MAMYSKETDESTRLACFTLLVRVCVSAVGVSECSQNEYDDQAVFDGQERMLRSITSQ